MSILYTINGQYPDKDFAFHISAENMSFANSEHRHPISDVQDLEKNIANKISADHSHTAVNSLTGDNFSVTGNIELQGKKAAVISVTGSTIAIAFDSSQTGNVAGVKNANPQRRQNMIKIHNGNKFSTTGNAEFIVFQEDTV